MTTIAVIVALLVGGVATVAWAGSKYLGYPKGFYNVVSSVDCGSNYVWLRSTTGGFGYADSTGWVRMQYRSGLTAKTKTFSGEFDGVSKTWYTSSHKATTVSFEYGDLSPSFPGPYAYAYWGCYG